MFLTVTEKSKLKEIKENISRGRTVLAEQDEFNRNSHSSRLNIDPDKISADGRNFHTTIINNPNLRVKLNKTLKSLLGLEIKIVTLKIFKRIFKK